MNEQQAGAARSILIEAFESMSDDEVRELIAAPFLDLVKSRELALVA